MPEYVVVTGRVPVFYTSIYRLKKLSVVEYEQTFVC